VHRDYRGAAGSYNQGQVQNQPSPSSLSLRAPSWAQILRRSADNTAPAALPEVEGRCVLVTGAGGFIGAEMVRRMAAAGAERLVLQEIAEQQLFAVHAEVEARGYGGRCVAVLGSVCDRGLIHSLFQEWQPELVLHAAALKHVPLMERNPLAALDANALGTWRVAEASAMHGVEGMILVSTDKAVAPHSIMGASKRIAELAMLAHAQRSRMRCVAVRLANVIGSPYSVGPLFQEQIERGGPVTVTHPAARRYFLTLEEVAGLLGEAMSCDGAEGILVPDPGEPVFIEDLARRMIAASGSTADVVFTELRPGDKLEESLTGPEERVDGPATPGLRRVRSPGAQAIEARIQALEKAVAARDLTAAVRVVAALASDYQPGALIRESIAEFSAARS